MFPLTTERNRAVEHSGAHLLIVAGGSTSLERLLADLTLDPPASTSELTGPPHLDDDWLTG